MRHSMVIALILLTTALFSESKKIRIGVLDLIANNVPQTDANTLTDLLRGELVRNGTYDVLDRNNMNTILKEQEFQQTGCTERSCAVRIGMLLNMQSMVYGTLAKLGDSYIITIDLIDIESSKITMSAKEKFAKIDNADDALARVVGALAAKKKVSFDFPGGLIAYYPLAGDTQDHSGNGFHADAPGGRMNPKPAEGRLGLPSTAYEFDGLANRDDGDYLEISSFKARQALKPTNAITVACWVFSPNWGAISGGGNGIPQERSILSTAEGGGWGIYCTLNNTIAFSVYVNGRYREPAIKASRLGSGWHHFTGTYDSVTGAALLYIDGTPVASAEGTASPIDYSRYPNTSMIIGADAEDGGGPETMQDGNTHFAGKIAEARIYNRALSETEVALLAAQK